MSNIPVREMSRDEMAHDLVAAYENALHALPTCIADFLTERDNQIRLQYHGYDWCDQCGQEDCYCGEECVWCGVEGCEGDCEDDEYVGGGGEFEE